MTNTAIKLPKTPNQEITGVFHKADELYQHPGSSFQKRTFYLKFDDSFIHNGVSKEKFNYLAYDAVGDKAIAMVNTLKEGDTIEVKFTPEGRLWRKDENSPTRVFMNNRAWGINIIQSINQDNPQNLSNTPPKAEPIGDDHLSDDDDDLPF